MTEQPTTPMLNKLEDALDTAMSCVIEMQAGELDNEHGEVRFQILMDAVADISTMCISGAHLVAIESLRMQLFSRKEG